MNIKDLIAHQQEVKRRMDSIIASMQDYDATKPDDEQYMYIDGKNTIKIQMVKVLPLLQVEYNLAKERYEKVSKALETAQDVVDGMMNKPE